MMGGEKPCVPRQGHQGWQELPPSTTEGCLLKKPYQPPEQNRTISSKYPDNDCHEYHYGMLIYIQMGQGYLFEEFFHKFPMSRFWLD